MEWDHIYMFILYHNAYLELEQLQVFYLFQDDGHEPQKLSASTEDKLFVNFTFHMFCLAMYEAFSCVEGDITGTSQF